MSNPLIKIEELTQQFRVGRQTLTAVHKLNLSIYQGETVGLVGESGSGKTTVGRSILQLPRPTQGRVFFEKIELTKLKKNDLKNMRKRMQMIFQDPYASLNPRMSVEDIIGEPLLIHRMARRKERVEELLDLVGLHKSHLGRFAHEFSGGQRQRIGIARALAMDPDFVVCDEPLSALDASVQAQVVNLLKRIQNERKLTYLFIAHDLALVKYISDRVAVMYLGELMELGKTDELYRQPLHPYTEALLSAIPIPDPFIERKRTRIILKSEMPSPLNPPKGCPFCTRCPKADKRCFLEKPKLKEVQPKRFVACHLF